MKALKGFFAAIALALLVSPSLGVSQTDPRAFFKPLGDKLSAAAINSTQTIALAASDLQGFGIATFHIDHTNSAATAVTMFCEASDDGGTTLFRTQDCNVSTGTCTSNDATWSKAVSANDKWSWRVDVTGFRYIKCSIDGTSADGSDTVTVNVDLSTAF